MLDKLYHLLLLCAAIILAGCRSPATQIELFLDTDIPSDRVTELRILSFAGAVEPSQIVARAQGAAGSDRVFVRGPLAGQLNLPGSIGILPRSEGNTDSVTLWIRARVTASGRSPEVLLDRLARVRFVRNVRGSARIFLPLGCGDRAVGCFSVTPVDCTVSVRCREQGATCGDNGECITPDLTVSYGDAGAPIDAPMVPVDATVQRPDIVEDPTDAIVGDVIDDTLDAPVDVPTTDAEAVVAPPQLLSPLSTSVVTSTQPMVRFRSPRPGDSGVVEFCSDRACTMVIQRVIARDSVTPMRALPRGWIYVRAFGARTVDGRLVTGTVPSPTWQFWIGARALNPAGSTATNGSLVDFNGDGFADIAAGSQAANNGALTGAGRVEVYLGAAGGLPLVPSQTLLGTGSGDAAGHVAYAGDVNGDGFGDLIVAAPDSMARRGTLNVYFGGPLGISQRSSQIIVGPEANSVFGKQIVRLGDVNQDGYADLAVSATAASPGGVVGAGAVYVFRGGPTGLEATPSGTVAGTVTNGGFGNALASGDLNGDGAQDLIVGFSTANVGGNVLAGEVQIFLGSPMGANFASVADRTLGGTIGSQYFGTALASGADIDGDGYADLVVGAAGTLNGMMLSAGSVNFYYGGPTIIAARAPNLITGDLANERFGTTVTMAQDLSGDGFADVIIGSPGGSPSGRAFFMLGSAMGIRRVLVRLDGVGANDSFGATVAAAGDVNGDGFGDFLIYAPVQSRGRMGDGSVSIFYGQMGGVEPMVIREIFGRAPNEFFGNSLTQ